LFKALLYSLFGPLADVNWQWQRICCVIALADGPGRSTQQISNESQVFGNSVERLRQQLHSRHTFSFVKEFDFLFSLGESRNF
jgi:hypothetical protein